MARAVGAVRLSVPVAVFGVAMALRWWQGEMGVVADLSAGVTIVGLAMLALQISRALRAWAGSGASGP